MRDWKKRLQTVILLILGVVSSGLLIGPYLQTSNTPPLPVVVTETDTSSYLIYDVQQGVEVVVPVEPADNIPDNSLSAITAKIVLNAQDVAEVGELVRFDLSESIAQSFKWITVPETADFEFYNNGRLAVFCARKPGNYTFIIAGAHSGTIDVAVHTLLVEGPPTPDILLITPSIQADLSEWVVYWCSVNNRPKDESERLAVSFEHIATQISAGTLQKAGDIVKATAEANRAAVGDSLPEWLPVLQELQVAMKKLATQGKLSTPDQHKALWLDIAKGLHNYTSLFGI
jgi:hypothetical protein